MIYALIAREAPRAVIFRRGPTKQVLLLSWDLETDEIVPGQWFKGHVYERRSDLSPDGKYLLYFAGKHRGQDWTWTALSKPPAFTALARWPKEDTYGGGLFESATSIALNHGTDETALAAGSELPPSFDVHPIAPWAGGGEDEPIWLVRLARDGWILTYAGTVVNRDDKAAVRWQLEPPRTWEKLHPLAPERYTLRMCLSGVGERQGSRYRMEHFVGDTHDVGRSDWADWAPNGDLLFARGFSLFRVPFAGGELARLEDAREIVNLANEKFVERRL
jgi:hypothetical protein